MNKYLNTQLVALLLVVLSACSVSKDIDKPAPELPASFRNTLSADSNSIADLAWRDFFTEPSLQKLIDSAIVKNYDLQIALKNIELVQKVLLQTRYAYLPDVKLQAGAILNRPSDNSLNGISLSQFLGKSSIEDYTTAVGISWEADIWGKIKNQKAAALAEYLQTAEVRKAIQTNIVANVAKGFYNLLMLDAQLEVAKKNVLLNDSTLRMVTLQYTAGQVTELAVEQVTAQGLQALQLIPQFEQQITVQENALSILTGVLPEKTERNTTLSKMVIPAEATTGIPSEMVNRRPDVRRNELALTVANAKVGIGKANMYPSLNITASGGVNAFKASNWFSLPASLFGSVAGSITAPLFQRKQLQTQYEVAKTEREKTVIQFRQSVLVAVGEVSDALVKIEKLKEQQSIVSSRRSTLDKAITNAQLLFKNGMATYLEVLTAQGNLLQAELETDAVKNAQLNQHVELYRALGGGWK
ncbi:MAG: efflux transporter outer membrane subunit [Bacteroidota bacterium]